jgi:hypothetical protein
MRSFSSFSRLRSVSMREMTATARRPSGEICGAEIVTTFARSTFARSASAKGRVWTSAEAFAAVAFAATAAPTASAVGCLPSGLDR